MDKYKIIRKKKIIIFSLIILIFFFVSFLCEYSTENKKKLVKTEINKAEKIMHNYKSKEFKVAIISANNFIQNTKNKKYILRSISIDILSYNYLSMKELKKSILCLERNFLDNRSCLFKKESTVNCDIIHDRIRYINSKRNC